MVKTLERILKEIEVKGLSEKHLHQAAMLAFMEAAQGTVNRTTMPTPLYRVKYDYANHTVEFCVLDGNAPVPDPAAQDISMLDMLLASLFREKLPIQLEGKTGIGKTHTTEQLFKAMLPEDNYRILRLNPNMSNVLQPYTEGTVENGVVKIKLKKEALQNIAAIFVDESNRGDANQILMMQDGTIRLPTGEGGDIGPQLSEYSSASWNYSGIRPTFVVLAQNPSATTDAKYSGARKMDAAQGNRNLQLDAPNTATSIGASLLMLKKEGKPHEQFKKEFRTRIRQHLQLEDTLDDLDKDWLAVFAYTTNPQRTECPNNRSAVEFMDVMLGLLSPDLKQEMEREKKTISDWNTQLHASYAAEFKYDGVITETAISIAKVREFVQACKEQIVPRDIMKVKKLADAISFMRRMDAAISSDDPMRTFEQARHYINVPDMSCALAITLYDKLENKDKDPVPLVAAMLKEYTNLTTALGVALGTPARFDPDSTSISIYNLAVQHALRETDRKKVIQDLANSVTILARNEAGNEYRKPMIARFAADMTTLAGFMHHYQRELVPVLASPDLMQRVQGLRTVYAQKTRLPSTPDIYLHRLPRVL